MFAVALVVVWTLVFGLWFAVVVVCCWMSCVRCSLLLLFRRSVCVTCCMLFGIWYVCFGVRCLMFVVRCLSCGVRCVLFVVRCVLWIVCCLLFVVLVSVFWSVGVC